MKSEKAPLHLGLALPMVSTGLPTSVFLAQLEEEARAAESAGFSYCLIPEHHHGPINAISTPLPLTSWLLARTTTLRIGPGVLLLPLHHPIHIAEDLALIQQLSGGRAILGVGAGYQVADFARFGVDRRLRGAAMDDGLNRIREAWDPTADSDVRVIPGLDGIPNPEIWLGAWSSGGLLRAAITADAWIADPVRTEGEVARMAAAYRQGCAESGRTARVVVMRELWVGESTEAAWSTFLPAVAPVYRYYIREGAVGDDMPEPETEAELRSFVQPRAIVGDVGEVVDRLEELQTRTGADAVICAMCHPAGPSHEQVLDALQRMGEVRTRLGR